jgi:hypothetical protein
MPRILWRIDRQNTQGTKLKERYNHSLHTTQGFRRIFLVDTRPGHKRRRQALKDNDSTIPYATSATLRFLVASYYKKRGKGGKAACDFFATFATQLRLSEAWIILWCIMPKRRFGG